MTVIGHNRIRRVDSFDGYEVLAHPLANREDRVFHRGEGGASQVGVTYGSHDIQIARPTGPGNKGLLAILMHHGGGAISSNSTRAPCRSPVPETRASWQS